MTIGNMYALIIIVLIVMFGILIGIAKKLNEKAIKTEEEEKRIKYLNGFGKNDWNAFLNKELVIEYAIKKIVKAEGILAIKENPLKLIEIKFDNDNLGLKKICDLIYCYDKAIICHNRQICSQKEFQLFIKNNPQFATYPLEKQLSTYVSEKISSFIVGKFNRSVRELNQVTQAEFYTLLTFNHTKNFKEGIERYEVIRSYQGQALLLLYNYICKGEKDIIFLK